jgi:hypothetical protein
MVVITFMEIPDGWLVRGDVPSSLVNTDPLSIRPTTQFIGAFTPYTLLDVLNHAAKEGYDLQFQWSLKSGDRVIYRLSPIEEIEKE